MEDEKIEITTEELFKLLKEAYRNGYAIYETVDAGLEPYDAIGYANWVILGLKSGYKVIDDAVNPVNNVEEKKIEVTTEELFKMLKEAYGNGFSSYKCIKIDLESYDVDDYY